MTIWIVLLSLIAVALIIGFLWIARRGRELRTQRPRPPVATKAHLEWQTPEGENQRKEVVTPFYFGNSSASDFRVEAARKEYEVCIFYHDHRFAYQALDGSGEVLVNGEELIAGYLTDGDVLQVADRKFVFRCS